MERERISKGEWETQTERIKGTEERNMVRESERGTFKVTKQVDLEKACENVKQREEDNPEKFTVAKEQDRAVKCIEGTSTPNNANIRKQKHLQLLRRDAIEIRQLQEALRAARVAKVLQKQLEEKECMRERAKCIEREEAKVIRDWYQSEEFQRKQEQEYLAKRLKYREDLQNQLVNNYWMRQQRDEERQRERKLVDEVNEVLEEENQKVREEKRATAVHLMGERDAFFKAKEMWKEKEKTRLQDEYVRIGRVAAEKEEEEKKRARVKTNTDTAKQESIERMARQTLDDVYRKREREEFAKELYEEKMRTEEANWQKNKWLEKERVKMELLADMEMQKELIEERRNYDAAMDRSYARQLAEEYEAALKKDNRENEARREKNVRYGMELKAAIAERRALHAVEILRKQACTRHDQELDNFRRKEIANERARMLLEYAPDLKGFLKPGIILNGRDDSGTCMAEC
ncbi:trichohyalin-like [Cephus cinctus]|uniref:Meiosis-specific nuclear structural protein 1 n=1 Tax=Cephus cinctus TaxID=211228 RepID=A0AAJ7VWW5_CEPCN|nr:trichohyalin-like [Cephus cinctus]XP_024936213.1 trichohyalin-like [Cephus cinctus]XP_024936214.1 trichohyalin-like [Cephus cinctus]